jgi:ABC-2 type transport system permease protein
VLKVVGSKGVEFLFSLPVVALFMILYRQPPSWGLVLLPVAIVLQAVLLTGLGLMLAATTVLVRDLQRVVRIGLRVMFYMSPIIYSVSDVPQAQLRKLFALNPMTGIVELYRAMAFPDAFAGWGVVGVAALICFAVLLWGATVFRRLESPVLKEL